MRIGDIAVVKPSFKPVYTIVTANAKPAVLLNIYRQPAGNTVTVADEVHREIEQHPAHAAPRRRTEVLV